MPDIQVQNSFEELLGNHLKNKKVVKIDDIALLYLEFVPGHKIMDPVSGQSKEVPASKKLGFHALKQLEGNQESSISENILELIKKVGVEIVQISIGQTFSEVIANEEPVILRATDMLIGKFDIKSTREIMGINPETKERITIPAKKRLQFMLSKDLINLLQTEDYPGYIKPEYTQDEETGVTAISSIELV